MNALEEVKEHIKAINKIIYNETSTIDCVINRVTGCDNCPFTEIFTEDGCVDFGCVLRTKISVLMEYVK